VHSSYELRKFVILVISTYELISSEKYVSLSTM